MKIYIDKKNGTIYSEEMFERLVNKDLLDFNHFNSDWFFCFLREINPDLYYGGHFIDSLEAIYESYEKEYTKWLEKNRALIAQELLEECFYCYEVKCLYEDIQQIKNYC